MWWKKKKNNELNMYVEQLQILKQANLKLREIYSQASKSIIAKDLISIIKTSEKIFDELMKNKNKIVKMNLFIEYYIQEVIKISTQYVKIKKLQDEESIKLCIIIEDFIRCVVIAFDSIYKDLISFDKTEMEISMDILLSELKERMK
ncbi:MAG: hypothetical protein E7314_06725 [Clostridiales bacterium]|nr:hypothetical protein [Clostridiales bacterium]